MNFTPRSAKEIEDAEKKRAEQFLIPNKSQCDFEVMAATDETSKKGNGMIHLKLHVFFGESFKIVDDYLLGAMEGKLRHFCEAVGLLKRYESGQLQSGDCVGKCGKAEIRIEKAKGDFPAKNSIRDYIAPEPAPEITPAVATMNDDDVPF